MTNRFVTYLSKLCTPLALFSLMFLLAACDATTRHKALTTLFDGVPSLPPPDELCAEYAKNKEVAAATETKPVTQVNHLPYEEKRCPDCHSQDKDTGGGLVAPRNELCFICHPDILQHQMAHGPAAVGDCLECHVPHSSSFPALLIVERAKVCDRCHTEQRLAQAMHDRFKQKGMACADCHDPHSGSGRFFLK